MRNNMILVASVVALSACAKVNPGYVAAKVNLIDDKGVQTEVVGPGYYFEGPNTSYYEFPTFSQNYTWTSSPHEGKAVDESITFQTRDPISLNADFGISYHIERDNVSKVFQKYRKGVEEITEVYLRNMVRDTLNEVAGTMTYDDILGKKVDFVNQVNDKLKTRAALVGITVEQLNLVGEFRPPEAIKQIMVAKFNATQNAIKIENELRATEAENKKSIANSQAEVEIARNQAEANRLRSQSFSKELIQQQWIQKWDGHLPPMYGNAGVIVNPMNEK